MFGAGGFLYPIKLTCKETFTRKINKMLMIFFFLFRK